MPMPPGLKQVVQRMIDAGEPEEAIASVIQRFSSGEPQVPALPELPGIPKMPEGPVNQGDQYKGPDTFWGGVGESLAPHGEVSQAMRSSLGGYAKGATIDLPGNIMGMGKTIYDALSDTSGFVDRLPGAISDTASNMWNTTQQAGSDPEAFGRMAGNVTGQPLVTAGIMKGAPTPRGAIQAAGRPVEFLGNQMGKQSFTGMIPRIGHMPTLGRLEKWVGGGIENIGKRMRIPTLDAEPGNFIQPFAEGNFTTAEPRLPPPSGPLGRPMPENWPTPTQPTMPQGFPEAMFPRPTQLELPPAGRPATPMGPIPDMGAQSPTAGSHMNSPAAPHGIPLSEAAQNFERLVEFGKSNPGAYANLVTSFAKSGLRMSGMDRFGKPTFEKSLIPKAKR